MKTVEIPGGIPVFISVQESKVYDKIVEDTPKSKLTPHDSYIAQQLVNKGVLQRIVKEKSTYYRRNRGSM